jgi:transcriptional regulator GlxA family with amidase domain
MEKKSNNIYNMIEKNIINEDRDFYDDLMAFKGDIYNEAEHQAWIDWASDLIMEKFSIEYNEALARISLIEDYYKFKGIIW